MNLNFINDERPHYVDVKPKRFVIAGKGYSELDVFIEDVIPIRKRFENQALVCYSQDGTTGKNGNHCIICRDRFKCRKRIRLMLMVQNVTDKPMPAILEVNSQSFEALKHTIGELDAEKLPSTLINMTVDKNETGALTVVFKPLF